MSNLIDKINQSDEGVRIGNGTRIDIAKTDVMYDHKGVIINLTKVFGRGHEPAVEEVDMVLDGMNWWEDEE